MAASRAGWWSRRCGGWDGWVKGAALAGHAVCSAAKHVCQSGFGKPPYLVLYIWPAVKHKKTSQIYLL